MGKIFHAKGQDRKAGVTILISDKINIKMKVNKKDEEGHYLMIKWSIQEVDITIINIYAPKIGAPRYLQQILTDIKGKINGKKMIVGDFNTPLTSMDRSFRQKINKATEILNNTIQNLDLLDIFRTLHLKTNLNIHSSQVHMEHSHGLTTY